MNDWIEKFTAGGRLVKLNRKQVK